MAVTLTIRLSELVKQLAQVPSQTARVGHHELVLLGRY